jgi:V/A-type H+-transporting ATPase subunit I
MGIAKMQKTALLISQDEAQKVLSEVQKYGFFEISESDSDFQTDLPKVYTNVESRLADIRFAIRFLSSYHPSPKSFREKLLGNRVEATHEEVLLAKNEDLSDVIAECASLEEQENQLKALQSKNKALTKALDSWKDLSLTLDFPRITEHTEVKVGSVEAKDYEDFLQEISLMELANIIKISESQKNIYFLLIFHKSISFQVYSVLESFRFIESDFADMTGFPADEIYKLSQESATISEKIRNLEEAKRSLALRYLRRLKLSHDALLWEKENKDAILSSTGTRTTIFLTGWVPVKKMPLLKEAVFSVTRYAEIFPLEPKENETPPVLLQNSRSIRPLERVMGLFGTPSYNELDPTPFMTPFFIIFFGFCLTDAGYGLLLVAMILIALKLFPLTKDMREMMVLLLYGGISTIILGVLFGGYFGMTQEQLPFLVHPETGKFYGQLFDPINDLVSLIMPLAYGLGALHLFLGVVLGGVNKWNQGDKQGAIFGNLILALLVVLSVSSLIFPAVARYLLQIMILLAPFLIWGFGPSGSGIIGRVLLGFLGVVNEAISWLSNILSYSRLFSLGLATGVIALAFNSIAVTLGGMMPALLGIPIMILLILFGHTLNIGLNLLGAFVHSGRLQFVEFFGKFLEGGGRKFSPLRRKPVYAFDSTCS